MEGTAPDKDKLLDIFYDKHMRTVVSRVTSGKHNIPEDESGNDEGVPPWSLTKIVDLLIFLVQNHQFRIKYYMLRNHVLQSVLQLMDRKEKYVVVSAVRFLRSCVNLKDEFYNRYLIKSNAFEPVMKVFKENGDRYNLLNSAVLELVDFIRRENIKNYKFFENDDSGALKAPLKVAEVLKEDIENFRKRMPLISCICNKGMRKRHWDVINGQVGSRQANRRPCRVLHVLPRRRPLSCAFSSSPARSRLEQVGSDVAPAEATEAEEVLEVRPNMFTTLASQGLRRLPGVDVNAMRMGEESGRRGDSCLHGWRFNSRST